MSRWDVGDNMNHHPAVSKLVKKRRKTGWGRGIKREEDNRGQVHRGLNYCTRRAVHVLSILISRVCALRSSCLSENLRVRLIDNKLCLHRSRRIVSITWHLTKNCSPTILTLQTKIGFVAKTTVLHVESKCPMPWCDKSWLCFWYL